MRAVRSFVRVALSLLVAGASLGAAEKRPQPARAIEIDFPSEVELPFARTSPLKPLSLSAWWVEGEVQGSEGPELFAWVSFGRVAGWHREIVRDSDGVKRPVYKGEWIPPDPAHPGELQIVVSTAHGGRAVHSAQAAAISAEIELPGRSEPDAEVEIMMHGESFGPVRAAHDGRFKVLVVVPPHTETAVAKSKDRLGNVNKKSVDLFVPKVSSLALACPFERVIAGAAPLPFAIATDLGKAKKPFASARQGRVVEDGAGAFSYEPPQRFTGPVDLIEVKSALGEARCEVSLAPGPAASASGVLEPPFIVADGFARAEARIIVVDRFGNPTIDAKVELLEAGGMPIALTKGEGAFTGTLISRLNVEKRTLIITVDQGGRSFVSGFIVHQMPDRQVRLLPVAGVLAVKVTPSGEGSLDRVSATDADGNDVELALEGEGVLRVKNAARAKGDVLFTHVPSGQSLLVHGAAK
ncbi:MAG: hypothetical protein IT381_12910 [Deltaproteobacteria bacterium]|nr:hypothetical protein [Deltaproteobacteria bacterium]